MTEVTNYRDYLSDLAITMAKIRSNPGAGGRMETSICRNGYGYRTIEVVGGVASSESWRGPIHADTWEQDDGADAKREIERFLKLPQILAYSDRALLRDRNPLMTSHWDATIAFVHTSFQDRGVIREQRMLFAGFDDPIHAEFCIAVDRDVLVCDHLTGTELYEWRSNCTVVDLRDVRIRQSVKLPHNASQSSS